jgi:hypothetical protein
MRKVFDIIKYWLSIILPVALIYVGISDILQKSDTIDNVNKLSNIEILVNNECRASGYYGIYATVWYTCKDGIRESSSQVVADK